VATLVALVGQRGDVGVYFGLEGGRQHPAGTIEDDLIERARISSRPSSSVTALNVGVPSSSARQRRLSSFWFNEEGTSRLRTNRRSTGSGQISPQVELTE
jgi:hypothetical protein